MTLHAPLAAVLIGASWALSAAGAAPDAAFSYPPAVPLDVVARYVDSAPKAHPRLLANAATLRRLSDPAQRTPLQNALAAGVVKSARLLEEVPPVERKLEGRRLLSQSRRCLERVLTLAMAYHLTHDQRFARRCEREMLAAAAFSDWNPSHFLDVAEMTLALAIGYDWLYDELTPDARDAVRTAIVQKGVRLPWDTQHNRWVKAVNNWGQVCHAGLTAGALAVMEDEPELAARTIQNAVNNVPNSMKAFAPKGSYPEGPGYWAYGSGFNVVLVALLEDALGTDFGLSQAPGFAETGGYLAAVTGPSGMTFNYADGGSGRGPQESLFWFAQRYHHPAWLRGEPERIGAWLGKINARSVGKGDNRLLPLALLWIEDDQTPSADALPLSWSSEGETPVTIHRSGWDDATATFVGVKAGSPSASHGHMDAGSFVLDADGVRWALDLGAENYHGIESRGMNLWDRSQDSDRWTIFRQMNHSHNTLVIDDQLQRAAGRSEVVKFSDDPQNALTIVDLTETYGDQARSIRRGVRLLPWGQVLIQDELTGLKPGTHVRWGMVTPGRPESDPGADEMVLRQEEATLRMKIQSPSAAQWRLIDTEKPRNAWDSPNRNTRMVAFESIAPDSGRLTLRVLLTPGSVDAPKPEVGGKPLSAW
ncbi:Heparinase II/III-like protein [Pirellulimonas nuda]|uniref:Heparinase II/III-like protein n=1 Tax=Pirellulimonas nuda TaxID=2528009 RepID=A0A518D6E4_9BACT|nr:heparinase II/III family protein [Pirellulimonas nuda]QDU87048.1 Heparinase II/III-like protein [Pirellulimonas nuda]